MPDFTPDPDTLRERKLFIAALELAGEARREFLDRECGGDAALRRRLDVLLADDPDTPAIVDMPLVRPEPVPRPGDAIGYFGDYVLLDEMARGGAGVVFRARQTTLNRIVALKMLRDRPLLTSDGELRRFRAEAEAIAALDHPNIVPVYEAGAHEGQAYFSMRLVEGGTLQFRAAEFADPRKAAALMAKVARAVHHAHRQGILHRDLKPGNILLDAAGEPHVSDFGLARRMDADSGLTVSGQIMGTPHYMAPEQARGKNRQLTPAADIYSLGAVLYELLAGRRPFEGEDFVALITQVTEGDSPRLRSLKPGLPRDLETIVHKCLEKAPASRYATAEALAEDLERWGRSEPILARPVSVAGRLAKWARRRPGHAVAAALAMLLAGTLSTVAVMLSRPPPPVGPDTLPPLPASEAWTWSGNRYQIIPAEGLSWAEAKSRAEALGGHLVVLTSMAESTMLWERAVVLANAAGTGGQLWLGGYREAGQTDWQWITGDPFEPLVFAHPPKDNTVAAWLSLTSGEADRTAHWNEFPDDSLRDRNLTVQIRGFCVEWDNAAPPVPLPGAGADGWVDLLAGLDLSALNPIGAWRMTDAGLHCASGDASFLEIPLPLPEEFDYEVEFTVTEGSMVHVSQFFPSAAPDHAIMLRHADGGITLGPKIDGRTEGEPGNGYGFRSAEPGKRCRSRVEVRAGAIRVLFNDEPALQWCGDFRRLTPEVWRSPRVARHPCLLCQTTDVTFHSVRVRAAAGTPAGGSFVSGPSPLGEPGSISHTLTSSDWKWEGPFNLGAGVNGPEEEGEPSLTADGLELFFHRGKHLFTARRQRLDEAFGTAQPVTELSRLLYGVEAAPFITPDGLMLYYGDDGYTFGKKDTRFDLAMTRRRDRQSPWEKPVILDISTPDYDDTSPFLTPDGLTLLFVRWVPSQIYISRRASVDEAFTTAEKLTGVIGDMVGTYSPFLCADGRTLLFSREGIIHVTLLDGTVTTGLAKLDLPGETLFGPCLSPDGLTLYAGAYHSGSHGLMDLCSFRRVRAGKGAGSR